MANNFLAPFPLANTSDAELQSLGQCLWNWTFCGDCHGKPSCAFINCPWSGAKRLCQFWGHYKEITATYAPELMASSGPALKSHEDLQKILCLLKMEPDTPRSQLTRKYFAAKPEGVTRPPFSDQNRAFSLAARILLMVNCTFPNQASTLLESGGQAVSWPGDKSICQFISEVLPKTNHPYLGNEEGSRKTVDVRSTLMAKKLEKDADIRFEATNDITNHLKLNSRDGIVQIFHYSAVLKENIRASRGVDAAATVGDFVKQGNLPRQLALEVLDSIYNILFPSDAASQSLLSSLVLKHGFDEDCLRYNPATYSTEGGEEISYQYFGPRLVALYEELENPTPRGWLQQWLERKSKARYVMMATLIGVLIAIVIGLLGLGVATFQAWVSYQQWKHPVNP